LIAGKNGTKETVGIIPMRPQTEESVLNESFKPRFLCVLCGVDKAELRMSIQKFLDNPFLLLFFGVMVPMVVYTLWGVIEILTVPLAK